MTKIKHMKTPERTRPGPKPKPEEEKTVKKTISLQPETFHGLMVMGDGVLSHGVELAYQAAKKRMAKAK